MPGRPSFRTAGKALGWGALALFALVLVGAFAGPAFVDWNRYKGAIAQQAALATGRTVRIAGGIGFSMLPRPALWVDDLRLANAPDATAPAMLSIARLEAQLGLLALLAGDIRVTRFRLLQPQLNLEVMADGRNNWGGAENAGGIPAMRFDDVLIEDATVTWRNLRSGAELRIEKIAARMRADSAQGPFRLTASLNLQDAPLNLTADIGTMVSGGAMPFALSVQAAADAGSEAVRLDLRGNAVVAQSLLRIKGALRIRGADLAQAMGRAAQTPQLPFEFASELSLEDRIVGFSNARLQIASSAASGAAKIEFGEATVFDAEINAASFDLNPLLDGLPFATGAMRLQIPETLKGALRLDAASVTVGAGKMRGVKLAIEVADGAIAVSKLDALLPGTSAMQINGSLRANDGKPHFSGNVELNSENFRALLRWAGAGPAAISETRLTRLRASAKLDVTQAMLRADAIDAQVDSSALTGSLGIGSQPRPSLMADLHLDQLNVDAYLPPALGPPFTLAGAWPRLAEYDANIKLTLDTMTYRGVPMSGIQASGELADGVLTLNGLSIANAAGSAIGASGVVTHLAADPQGEVNLRLLSKDVSGLARLLQLPETYGVNPGAVDAQAKLLFTGGRIDATLDALAGETSLKFASAITGVAPGFSPRMLEAASLDARLEIINQSLAKLGGQVDLAGLAPVDMVADAPVSIRAGLSGNPAALRFDAIMEVARAHIILGGELANLTAGPACQLNVDARGDALTPFLRGLGIDFRPAGADIGGFALAAAIDGNEGGVTVTHLGGSIGPVAFQGGGQVKLDGPKPVIHAVFDLGEILADPFLPLPAPKGPAGGGAPVRQLPWSGDPLDLAALGGFDAAIAWRSPHIVVRGLDLADVKTALKLNNGTLELREFSGKLSGGPLSVAATLRGGAAMADFAAHYALSDADIAAVSAALLGESLITGRLDFSGDVQASGASTFALVSSLAGSGKLKASDGVIRGIDLPSLNKRLGEIEEVADLITLMRGAFTSGQTGYKSAEIPFVISSGVVQSGETALDIEAVDGRLNISVDLTRYRLDAGARLALKNHAGAPGFGVSFTGALNNPERNLQTQELEKYYTGILVTASLQRLLGAAKAAPPPSLSLSPEPVPAMALPPPEAPQPEKSDAVKEPGREPGWRSLLKGVFGGEKK